MAVQDHISLTVLSPEKMLLEKMVSKVELPGSKGRFVVLKNHEPLISSLEEGFVSFVSEGVPGKIEIVSGFAEVAANKVIVCVEL